MSKSAFVWIAALVVIASGPVASASTAIEVSLREIAWLAEFIYAGTVTDTTCFVSEDGMNVTEYRFTQLDVVKAGRYGSAERLRLVGTPPSNIIGQPTLEIGSRYIVFSAAEFYSSGKGRGAIIGLDQGLFRVGTDYRGRANALIDSKSRAVVDVKEGCIVVVGTGDNQRTGGSGFRVTESTELPPSRPRNLPPASAPRRPPSSESHLITDVTAPQTKARPPDPVELEHVRSRWESRPKNTSGEPIVQVIERTADKGKRLSEREFLLAVRAMMEAPR